MTRLRSPNAGAIAAEIHKLRRQLAAGLRVLASEATHQAELVERQPTRNLAAGPLNDRLQQVTVAAIRIWAKSELLDQIYLAPPRSLVAPERPRRKP